MCNESRIWTRPVGELTPYTARGYSPAVARILSGRGIDPDAVTPSLAAITPPDGLPDIETAARLLADAIENGVPLYPLADFDGDGLSGCAVFCGAMDVFGVPGEQVTPIVGHRLIDGYGVTPSVATRLLALGRPGVVMTIDCGSSDREQIARLQDAGHRVICTDHHQIPSDGGAINADAFVSPLRDSSTFGDPTVSGSAVAFLVMWAVRNELHARGRGPLPSLSGLLDLAGAGVQGDCVSLLSHNNRAMIRHSLSLINARSRPCWDVLLDTVCDKDEPFTSEGISFQLIPRINARSRVDEPLLGLAFFRARDRAQAQSAFDELDAANAARKAIERTMVDAAIDSAVAQAQTGRAGCAVFLADGHLGVNGLVASRIAERLGRPTLILSPSQGDPQVVTGSARAGLPVFNVKESFDDIRAAAPGLLLKAGGHAAAGGCSCALSEVHRLVDAFLDAADAQVALEMTGPYLLSDGPLPAEGLSLAFLSRLDELEPFGQGFECPAFELTGCLLARTDLGRSGEHFKIVVATPTHGRQELIVFFGQRMPGFDTWTLGEERQMVVRPRRNFFRGAVPHSDSTLRNRRLMAANTPQTSTRVREYCGHFPVSERVPCLEQHQ